MRGSLDPRILWLTLAVTLWTAGFDIIYACQDYAFDVQSGLFSIPKRFGIARALWISRAFHLGMLVSLLLLVHSFGLGGLAWQGSRRSPACCCGSIAWSTPTTSPASTRPSSP